ncbi:MAG: NrsF family protein [Thermoanaerobaculales bacterium]
MNAETIPESLRRAIAEDFQPVEPLPPAWKRTLVVAAVMAVGFSIALVAFKFSLRPDMPQIPLWLSWGCTILQLLVGVLLVGMALREAVPGSAVPTGAAALAIGTAVLMQILVGVATWMHSPGVPMGDGAVMMGVTCATHDMTIALPALLTTLWLVFRALPIRPSMAGLLGGAGAAVTADGITHLLCPMSDLRHVLVWHTGALLGLMLVGWTVGRLWEWRKLRHP